MNDPLAQPDCFSNGVPIRCYKCRTALDVGAWIMANVAPGAASGGTLMPFHPECAPIVFHGPTFVDDDLRQYLIGHEADIAHRINDFCLLEESFKRIVGREPKALSFHPDCK